MKKNRRGELLLSRRGFAAMAATAAAGLVVGCASEQSTGTPVEAGASSGSQLQQPNSETAGEPAPNDATTIQEKQLPAPNPDPNSDFGVDANVNMATIDDYLDIPGIVLRDMRLIDDPARYEDIGGSSKLSFILEGFEVVPYPYVGTLAPLPVEGAYDGLSLFTVTWASEGLAVEKATPNYTQSLEIIQELFPQDKPILLMCGGAGYAAMMKALLEHLGWDPSLLYNIGGAWDYEGSRAVQLISYAGDEPTYYLWRAPVACIEFDALKAL